MFLNYILLPELENCYVGEAREEISMLMKGFQNRTNLAERQQCGGCNYYFYTIMMEVQGLPFFLFSKYDDPAAGSRIFYTISHKINKDNGHVNNHNVNPHLTGDNEKEALALSNKTSTRRPIY